VEKSPSTSSIFVTFGISIFTSFPLISSYDKSLGISAGGSEVKTRSSRFGRRSSNL